MQGIDEAPSAAQIKELDRSLERPHPSAVKGTVNTLVPSPAGAYGSRQRFGDWLQVIRRIENVPRHAWHENQRPRFALRSSVESRRRRHHGHGGSVLIDSESLGGRDLRARWPLA